MIAGIGEDALDERERPAPKAKNLADTIAILDVGRMNDDAQQQTQRVDEDGLGIPVEDLDRLLERYYGASNASGIVGTGVGL